jgi:phenylpyruvate tautomerase PptA (4-oxalocrotonate tautomerase family)
MPTYVCSIPPNTLTDEQKTQIAVAIGTRHSEASRLTRTQGGLVISVVLRPMHTSGFAVTSAAGAPTKLGSSLC